MTRQFRSMGVISSLGMAKSRQTQALSRRHHLQWRIFLHIPQQGPPPCRCGVLIIGIERSGKRPPSPHPSVGAEELRPFPAEVCAVPRLRARISPSQPRCSQGRRSGLPASAARQLQPSFDPTSTRRGRAIISSAPYCSCTRAPIPTVQSRYSCAQRRGGILPGPPKSGIRHRRSHRPPCQTRCRGVPGPLHTPPPRCRRSAPASGFPLPGCLSSWAAQPAKSMGISSPGSSCSVSSNSAGPPDSAPIRGVPQPEVPHRVLLLCGASSRRTAVVPPQIVVARASSELLSASGGCSNCSSNRTISSCRSLLWSSSTLCLTA